MTNYDIEYQEFTQSERMWGRAQAAAFTVAAWCIVILIITS